MSVSTTIKFKRDSRYGALMMTGIKKSLAELRADAPPGFISLHEQEYSCWVSLDSIEEITEVQRDEPPSVK